MAIGRREVMSHRRQRPVRLAADIGAWTPELWQASVDIGDCNSER